MSQLVENYYANLAHYLTFCVFSITKYCHQCAPPAVWATYRQERDEQMQPNSQTWVTLCFFSPFFLQSVSFSFFLFVLLGLSSSHIETLCQTDVYSCKTRGVNKKTASKQEGNRKALLSLFMQPCLYGEICTHEHISSRTRLHSRKHTGTNNHMVVSNQVCSPNYPRIWRVVTHE